MTFISKTIKFLSVFILVIGLASCSSDDDNTPAPQTVVDIAVANGLTSLAAALEATNLVSVLEGEGPFTVFGPTNAAFDTLLAATGIDLNNMSAAELAAVTNILLNHVIVDENISASELVTGVAGYKKTEAIGPNGENLSIFYAAVSDVVLNGQSTVTGADKTASNGVLHIVNTVIALPTIATFATTNSALEDLVSALESGKILGAGLDVLEYEKASFENLFASEMPEAFQYLIKAKNVLLSPHVAGWTVESKEKLAQIIVDKIKSKFY